MHSIVSSLFNGLEVVRTRQINDGTSYAADNTPQYGAQEVLTSR